MNKPNGMTVILPKDAESLESLPIEDFHGIGKVTALKMHALGICNGLDLKKCDRYSLIKFFSRIGNYYYNIARAKDNREVEANRICKSIGAAPSAVPSTEETSATDCLANSFAENFEDKETIIIKLEQIAQILVERIERHQASGRTLTLKVKFSDYQQITRSRTFENCINSLDTIITEAVTLLEMIELSDRSIRLLGISLSNLDGAKKSEIVQLSLFE